MKTGNFEILIFWVGIIVTAIVITLILRPVTRYIENLIFKFQTAKSIAAQRNSANGAPSAEALKLRRTDNVTTMSKADREAFKYAEELVKQGKLVEAAYIFERIGFSRRAIDFLEGAGLIDEACAVLIRMKSIGRAGVVYERNHLYEKAAHCYSEAAQHEQAGKAFLKLTASNFHYFNSAAQSFAKAEKWDAYLRAVAEVLDTDKVIDVALAHGHAEFMVTYLANPEIGRDGILKIRADAMKGILEGLTLTPRMIVYSRHWASITSQHDFEILRFVQKDSELCSFFWSGLDEATRTRLSILVKDPTALPEDVRKPHLLKLVA